jgi:hypothetical protein
MTKPVYWSPLSFAQSLRVISWVRQWDLDKLINWLIRFAARMFMKIRPMESNLLNSASDFLYHTHFYFNILSLAAKISARWLHCHKHRTCYSIVSCSPLILIGAHFHLSQSINYTTYLFSKKWWKNDCVQRSLLSRIRALFSVYVWLTCPSKLILPLSYKTKTTYIEYFSE